MVSVVIIVMPTIVSIMVLHYLLKVVVALFSPLTSLAEHILQTLHHIVLCVAHLL